MQRPTRENLNEWQVAGIQRAAASLDRGERVPHKRVKELG